MNKRLVRRSIWKRIGVGIVVLCGFNAASMSAEELKLAAKPAVPAAAKAVRHVAVICPQPWRATLRPWTEHRIRQGYRLHFVQNKPHAEPLRQAIIRLHREQPLSFIVLVGDTPQAGMSDAERALSIPTYQAKARVNVLFGSEKTIASDNYFADVDGDQVPDVPIGRLSVDNKQQLANVVHKILHYERSNGRRGWQNRIHMVAGVGGFGGLVDHALETITKKFLADGIPARYDMSITFGSWRSPFCPDPRAFHQTTIDRLNDGCLFFVYVGHGQRKYLDYVRVPDGFHKILERRDAVALDCKQGHPIAIFLACYTGAFDFPEDCLAEELLRSRGGPVAVYAGSRVTMPYAMGVMANGLMDEYFHHRRPTLGEVLLHSKIQMIKPQLAKHPITHEHRRLADTLAALISPKPRLLGEERLEHLWLYNLMGDPMLVMPKPAEVKLALDGPLRPGESFRLRGTSPLAGKATVELLSARDKNRHQLAARTRYDNSPMALAAYQGVYRKANDHSWWKKRVTIEAGEFEFKELIPKDLKHAAVIRVIVENEDGSYAVGAVKSDLLAPAE